MFRKARLALFRRVVHDHGLLGVILAHHRLDQAETIFLRLMRGGGPGGLRGMAAVSDHGGLRLVRPLLQTPPQALRAYLQHLGQPWREDISNRSSRYRRNRVRMLLNGNPGLIDSILKLGRSCDDLAEWVKRVTPTVLASLPVDALDGLPPIVREQAARMWLVGVGVPVDDVNDRVVHQLLRMMDDAAAGRQADFPGAVRVIRRKRAILAKNPGTIA